MFFASRVGGAVVLLAAALFGSNLQAAPVWLQVSPVGTSGTSLTGTLGSIPVTLTSSGSAVTSTPSVNPPYNSYDIWDNNATDVLGGNTVYPNGAGIWPASAMGNMQYVIAARPVASLVTLRFAHPVFNPQVLIYSLDNSHVDFSQTTNFVGGPASISAVTNTSAQFVAGTKRLDRGPVPATFPREGCSRSTVADPNVPSGRGCGVLQFQGYYSEIKMTFVTDTGGNDGVGFQVGYEPNAAKSVEAVPTLAPAGLAALGLIMAGFFGWRRRSQR
ncbi:hypothetical protein [Ottowia thiooxydans]|uniref:IPTL-CTERM protein sorting domain-containing protein n=1 Tax=Ottowia thiooxydans TaxID=219182 RepID=A0ABV2QCM6_9BURK